MRKLIFTIILLFCFQLIHAEKYALIIAIGDYPKSTGWRAISSVNDVPLIKQTLLNQKFEEKNITLLINEEATFAGIKTALENLLSKINPDDIVVIHYSGHGQQIFDDDDGEEIDGKDEAIVPYDAWVRYNHNYKGENHFRDDELGNYITKFRNALKTKGQLLLLLDSCHSGSSTRGSDKARGSQAVFAPDGWEAKVSGNATGSDMIEDSKEKLIKNAAPFILISGASANELNYEYKGTGSLSYAFSKAMSDLGSNYSYNQLFAKIETEMNIISPKQTPTIEGDINIELFNNSYVKQQPYFKVKSIHRTDVLKIQAGKLHGLFKNTTVNILPSASTKVTEDAILAKGTITLAKFNESIIKLNKPLSDLNEKKYWVFIDTPSYGDISVDVFFHKSLKDKPIKTGVAAFLADKKLGQVVTEVSLSDIVIMDNGSAITLNSPNGLDNIDKDNNARGSNSLESINNKIFSFAQGQYLKNLDLKNHKYEFEFNLLPIEFDEITEKYEYLSENEFNNDKGTFQIRPGEDHVLLKVTNKSDKPLYFNIIEINSKGEINTFFPKDDVFECSLNNNERKISPNSSWVFEECVFHFASPYEKLVLKGFATPYPLNFQNTLTTRGVDSNAYSNPLEKLLAESFKETRGSTGSSISNSKIDGYSTEFVYEIIEK